MLSEKHDNPHKGGTEAYIATEHYNEGWNDAVAALRAQADVQPVAWMHRDGGAWELSFVPDDGSKPKGATQCLPLVHPAPEAAQALSDEDKAVIKTAIAYLTSSGEHVPLRLVSGLDALLTRSAAPMAEQLAASQQLLGAEFDKVLQDSLPDLYIEDGATVAEQSDGLDFTPDEHHTIADMANVGYALMQAIKANRPDYAWNESPAEIVVDLINEAEEAAQQQAEPVGDERAAFERAIRNLFPRSYAVLGFELREDGEYRKGFIREARHVWQAARAAQSGQRAGVAEGWRLVPEEPTDVMLKAGIKAFQHAYSSDDLLSDWAAFYRAAIKEDSNV